VIGVRIATLVASMALVAACREPSARPRLTFSGSAVGAEATVVKQQLARFAALHPDLDVELRITPDASDQRHQLYVQWLNARVPDPDVLQLDVIWTAEFAGAGWLLPLDRDAIESEDFVPAALAAAEWRRTLYGIPWFVDVGLLYRRTDLVASPPQSLVELCRVANQLRGDGRSQFGLIWQGARYEGLVTVFVEFLGAFGGRIMDDDARVVVDSPAAVRALTFMHDAITSGCVPSSVLAWQEEQTRLTFQNGDAVFMRNWPYAAGLLQDGERSRVAGRFAVTALPAEDGGRTTVALGGSHLAVNAHSVHPSQAVALVEFLTAPEQMRERARLAAQLPARRSVYSDLRRDDVLPAPIADLEQLLDAAVARPATPVYSELSELLQVQVHRALSGQKTPEAALRDAAKEMRDLLARSGLAAPFDVAQGRPDSVAVRTP
jgi:multiple sugar transport system substrate-binding protein